MIFQLLRGGIFITDTSCREVALFGYDSNDADQIVLTSIPQPDEVLCRLAEVSEIYPLEYTVEDCTDGLQIRVNTFRHNHYHLHPLFGYIRDGNRGELEIFRIVGELNLGYEYEATTGPVDTITTVYTLAQCLDIFSRMRSERSYWFNMPEILAPIVADFDAIKCGLDQLSCKELKRASRNLKAIGKEIGDMYLTELYGFYTRYIVPVYLNPAYEQEFKMYLPDLAALAVYQLHKKGW